MGEGEPRMGGSWLSGQLAVETYVFYNQHRVYRHVSARHVVCDSCSVLVVSDIDYPIGLVLAGHKVQKPMQRLR